MQVNLIPGLPIDNNLVTEQAKLINGCIILIQPFINLLNMINRD